MAPIFLFVLHLKTQRWSHI